FARADRLPEPFLFARFRVGSFRVSGQKKARSPREGSGPEMPGCPKPSSAAFPPEPGGRGDNGHHHEAAPANAGDRAKSAVGDRKGTLMNHPDILRDGIPS